MMKTTTAHRAESKPRTPSFVALLAPALVAVLAACQGTPEPEPAIDPPLADGEQSLTAADCRQDPSGCLSAAGGASGRRSFPVLRPLVSRVIGTGARAVRGVFDVADALPAVALSGVKSCRGEVVICLDAAVTELDIGTCADSLEACVDGVVDILDPVLDPLPGPSASGIVAATDVCRADARACVEGALSLNDIRACSVVLGACIDGVEDILGETVDDVNEIIDPLALPQPENVIDCTLELAECLADLNNPFECAEDARVCASQ